MNPSEFYRSKKQVQSTRRSQVIRILSIKTNRNTKIVRFFFKQIPFQKACFWIKKQKKIKLLKSLEML